MRYVLANNDRANALIVLRTDFKQCPISALVRMCGFNLSHLKKKKTTYRRPDHQRQREKE